MDLKLLVVVIQLLSILQVSCEKSVRTISLDEYNNLAASTSGAFVAVYYDNQASRKNYPQFLKEFRKAVGVLDSYGIELLKIDCKGLQLPECKESNVYTFRNGISEDSLGLDVFFNEDSIVSNLLQLLLKSETVFVSDTNHVNEIIQNAKQSKKNVVFSYVKGLGNADHATYTKLAYVFADKFKFVLTTHKDVANQIKGLSTKSGGSLAVHSCQDVDSADSCKVIAPTKMTVINAAQLLQLLQLPKYVYLSENGTTVYDSLPLSVHKVYIFTDDVDKLDQVGLKSITDDYYGIVGVIIVDTKKHKDKLSSFGLSDKDTFPTGAFVPAAPRKSEPIVELFPDQIVMFLMANFKYILGEFLHNSKKQYKYDADISSLKSMNFEQFSKISSPVQTFLLDKSYVMVAFCEKGSTRSECRDFSKHFRRVVRTFDRREEPEVAFVHVTLSNGGDNEIGTPKRPYVRFYDMKKGDQNFAVFKGPPDFHGMMDFIQTKTKISSITRLQPSNSDRVPINEDVQEEQKPDAEEEEEIQVTESSSESPQTPPEETEDDEVAGSVWYSELPNVPEDKVPSLTDKTFQPTRDQNDLLVVNFFQPWDPRSRALVGPYVEAAVNLGKIDVGKLNVRLARVNCFDWTDVCQHNNITTYPTIKLYRKGVDEFVYKGPLDAENLVKTVLLLHTASPLKLDSEEQVQSFLLGKLPVSADRASHVAVLGFFSAVDAKELKAFTKAAKEVRGSFIFGFVTGETAMKACSSYGVKTPAILLVKRNDALQPASVFDGDFSPSNIVDFIKVKSLPLFGELSPLNLPLYLKHDRPFLIAFRATAIEDTTFSPIIETLARDTSLRDSIFLTWISLTSSDVNEVILQSYTGKKDTPALVVVDHKKGLIFQFKNAVSLQKVSDWVKRCLSGEEKPSNKLKDGKWEPLLEGYNYLELMDKDAKEEAKKKAEREEDDDEEATVEEVSEKTGKPVERLRQRKPEDFRDEDERKEHDEL